MIGASLRAHRLMAGKTLRQVSADARVSLGYISEIERGHKEASSELLAALCEAIDLPLSTLLRDVAHDLDLLDNPVASRPIAIAERRHDGPVALNAA